MPGNERMRRAYRVAGKLFRDRLRQERPADAEELSGIEPAEIVVVRGEFDHMHLVLDATGVPFLHLAPTHLPRADWKRMQVLLINCPGQLPAEALERLDQWVREGGYLMTTDWALKHLIEPVFPGTLRHNGERSADCVVRVQSVEDGNDPLLGGFLEDGREPLWWLEGQSFPIEVLDSKRVRVLMRSSEVAERWGQDPVVVTFDEGRGTVLHMMSHLYLQRSDVRTARDAQPAAQYAAQALGMDASALERFGEDFAGLRAADFSSALRKQRILSDWILSSRKRRRRKEVPQ